MEPQVNLTLSVAEINLVLNALGKLPYENVAQLIPKIASQGQSQLDGGKNHDQNN